MSEKRVWTVTLITTHNVSVDVSQHVRTVESYVTFTEEAAKQYLLSFHNANAPDVSKCISDNRISGFRREKRDGIYVNTDVRFYGLMRSHVVDTNYMCDAEADHIVEMEVTKTFNISTTVRASDVEEAKEKARDLYDEGEFDSQFQPEYADDTDMGFVDVYEE
jgi:hypothetical protein